METNEEGGCPHFCSNTAEGVVSFPQPSKIDRKQGSSPAALSGNRWHGGFSASLALFGLSGTDLFSTCGLGNMNLSPKVSSEQNYYKELPFVRLPCYPPQGEGADPASMAHRRLQPWNSTSPAY